MEPKPLSIRDLDALKPPSTCAPLRGYIIQQDKTRMFVQDREATWLVPKDCIVEVVDWEGVGSTQFKGKPACLMLKEGSEIFELRPTKIRVSGRPLTIMPASELPPIQGDQELKLLAEGWMRHLGFRPNERAMSRNPVARSTACCWDSGGAVDCSTDDCGPDVCS